MRLVILHYHFFKNAGTTFLEILDHSFGERFAMVDTPDHEGVISNRELVRFFNARPNVCALSSHQIRHPLPEAPGYLFFDLCFLRDPIDRIRSMYTYFRKEPIPDLPLSDLANRATLGDFVAGVMQDFPRYVKNAQVNLLACAGDSDEPEPRDLEVAIERMLATSFLGVVDCFDQSVAAGVYALRRVFPELDCNRPPVNVSEGLQGTVASRTEKLRQACGEERYEELLRMNALDRQLVDRARAEVLRRFRRIPPRAARPAQPEKRRVQAPGGFPTAARRFASLAPYWRVLSGSARKTLFDADYYRRSSPEGRAHPLLHFLVRGAYQGRQPHPLFDPAFYLRKYPDVAASGANPLCHYLKYGARQSRQPHPLFDAGFYLARSIDVRGSRMNPLVHYLRHGAAEDRKPIPWFDPGHYRRSCAEAPKGGQNLLAHFLESGAGAASPHPLFDCEAYLDAHPDAAAQGENPLVHYLLRDAGPPAGRVDLESAAIAQIDIEDVKVTVVLLAGCLDSKTPEERHAIHEAWKSWAARHGMSGSVALVWRDASGLAQWVAEAQERPFLEAVRLDQIGAQGQAAMPPGGLQTVTI
jgi:hypothetical protein